MGYEETTQGIRVTVQPAFSLARSDLSEGRFVFTYMIEMENEGELPAQLLFRHWDIHEAGGDDTEVDGEGVVGEQPVIAPGGLHAYSSFCVLHSPIGSMTGYFTFVRPDGREFRVQIPRFELEAPLGGSEAPELH